MAVFYLLKLCTTIKANAVYSGFLNLATLCFVKAKNLIYYVQCLSSDFTLSFYLKFC